MKFTKVIPLSLGIALASLLLAFNSSCRHDDDISQLPDVCFQTEILPIFKSNCALSGCHGGGGHGPSLSSYAGIMEGVTPGKPEKSRVYRVLSNVWSVESMMPPDRPLSEENRSKIRVWIEQGAKDTTCP